MDTSIIIVVVVLGMVFLLAIFVRPSSFLGSSVPSSEPVQEVFLTITVPPIPWEPTQAEGLMKTLYQLGFDRITFTIVATRSKITWEIGPVGEHLIDTISNAILSFYPQADIDVFEEEDEEEAEESDEESTIERTESSDLAWINSKLYTLSDYARKQYKRNRFGAVIVDMISPGLTGPKFSYKSIDDLEDEEVVELLEDYNPETEMVVMVMKPEEDGVYKVALASDDEDDEEVVVETFEAPEATPPSLSFAAIADYFAPFSYAADHKALDPLASIVGAMAHLQPGESIVYSLEVQNSTRNYGEEGYKKIRNNPSQMGTLLQAGVAAVAKMPVIAVGTRPGGKYETHYQHLFEQKLLSTPLPVRLTVEIHANDSQRFYSLREGLISATTVFDRVDGNKLTTWNNKSFSLVLSPQEAATLWHLPSEHIHTSGVVRGSGAKAPLPTELLEETSGLLLGHNTYQGRTSPVYLAQRDRITHMNIIGKTRVGKTTFMHNLIHQDIAEGRGVGVIDPHGDLIRAIMESSIPVEREKDVVLFDLADVQNPVALNLLYVPPGVPRHAAVGLTLGVMKKIFAEQWSATRMEDALYSALAVLANEPGATIRDIPKLFFDETYRSTVLSRATDTVALEYWNDDYGRMSERYQMEVARPIMNRIRAFYRNPVIERIVVQPTSLDFREMMDQGKIFLGSLAGEATQAESATIGALLISKIQMAAMSRASIPAERRRMFYLYIDEVQNFITTSLSTMFSEAAKYALSLTVANQFLSQLEGGTLEAIIGNTGTTVMFACGAQDAEDLGRYVKPTFDTQTLMNLDRFQTILKMQYHGKTLPAFSMETLPPPEKPEDASERVARIKQHLQGVEEPTSTPADEQSPVVTLEPENYEVHDSTSPSPEEDADIPRWQV